MSGFGKITFSGWLWPQDLRVEHREYSIGKEQYLKIIVPGEFNTWRVQSQYITWTAQYLENRVPEVYNTSWVQHLESTIPREYNTWWVQYPRCKIPAEYNTWMIKYLQSIPHSYAGHREEMTGQLGEEGGEEIWFMGKYGKQINIKAMFAILYIL